MLVVGGGAAGGAAALAAAAEGASVGLITKAELQEGNTLYAQGGLAAVMDPSDSFESHVADTLEVGRGLAEPGVVEHVVRGGPDAVERLVGWGARFDRRADGSFDLSREGGHGLARILHARGDSTGLEIQAAITRAVSSHDDITNFPDTFVVDLLRSDDGAVCGALVADPRGEHRAFLAEQVILATGGAGQVYRETTNPAIATGDGVALGLRVGATVRDAEFFQFHPTCLYIAGAARVLISEIVRGAGGVLRDRDGVRFMPESHPAAELAPRDVVSRAVFQRMVATKDTSVYLDLSEIDGDPHAMFPGISRTCRFFGIDIARDPVPVRPGAHYMIGGLRVDLDGRTSVPGLWAAGECACSGLHGANRMGSNSLLEGLVLGTTAGRAAAAEARAARGRFPVAAPDRNDERDETRFQVNIQDVTYSLKSLMWRQMGVVRDAGMLADALDKIALWTRAVSALGRPHPRTFELLNLLTVARLATLGASFREESRGVHYRGDHPETLDAWRVHTDLVPRLSRDRIEAIEATPVPVGAAEHAR